MTPPKLPRQWLRDPQSLVSGRRKSALWWLDLMFIGCAAIGAAAFLIAECL